MSSSSTLSLDSRKSSVLTSQEAQYCPVTQYVQYCFSHFFLCGYGLCIAVLLIPDLCRFVGQLLRLLVCANEKFGAQIQKHVKELVGHEMAPALYPILFDQIKVIVEKFFDQQGQVIHFFSCV